MPLRPLLLNHARMTLGLADKLRDGIQAERFARLANGAVGAVPSNHPAWIHGHLGLYGTRVAALVGDDRRAAEAAAPEGWADLFGAGSTCRDDPEGGHYPAMKTLVTHFEKSTQLAMEAVEEADPVVFERTNPNEAMRERFPTIGPAVGFLLSGHATFHLGQLSAWRRMEGLGPV